MVISTKKKNGSRTKSKTKFGNRKNSLKSGGFFKKKLPKPVNITKRPLPTIPVPKKPNFSIPVAPGKLHSFAEKFGYRYRLTIDSPSADQIESVKYVQLGAKLIAEVKFKETVTGRFTGRFETRAWLERHATAILGLQVSLMLLLAASLVYLHVKRSRTDG